MLSINQVGASKKGAEDSFIFQTALADYFSGAIEVKGESGCFLGYCSSRSLSSQLQIERFTSITPLWSLFHLFCVRRKPSILPPR